MIINLCDGISVTKSSQTFPVCLKDLLIDRRRILLQPGEKGGAKIEADGRIIIEDIQDLLLSVNDPGISIRPIAFKADPFVPVVKRMSALLGLDDFKPRVLPRRLIEMTMNGDISIFDLWSIRHNLNPASLSYIRRSISKEFLVGNIAGS
jgi:hypothetical protein